MFLELILSLQLLVSPSYKERKAGLHRLKVNPCVTFQLLKQTKSGTLYKTDPEFSLSIRELAYFKYTLENKNKFEDSYMDTEQIEAELMRNFKYDWNYKETE
jgi:hypothetical protein